MQKNEISEDVPDIAATCFGVCVPASRFLTETRIERINSGLYEGQEIAAALALIEPKDRVLELGAGLGIVGAVIATKAKPAAVMSYEANPDLMQEIKALHCLNELEGRVVLKNEVLMSPLERPDTVDVHIGNSFLGASLFDQGARRKRTVSVPTADFNQVREAYKPSVLVMDIEGAELDLLQHVSLDGIRAVIVEFHPNIYGAAGMRQCKNILRDTGFERVDAHSTRTVWACQRADVTDQRDLDPTGGEQIPPRPNLGWSSSLTQLDNAHVVPPTEGGFVQAAGVLHTDGRYCPQAALWRKGRPITTPPKQVLSNAETLPGTWLWGGVLWGHFGHFIVESTSRLWALPDLVNEIDGVLFIPKRPRREDTVFQFQRDFLDLICPDVPIEVAYRPRRVERLIVPGQGFGLGKIAEGTKQFRATMANHFAKSIEPAGAKKLYVSRSRINRARGTIVKEEVLEERLRECGYDILYPEQHEIATQVARYKAADTILACEGSALHLIGMTARSDQKIGVVLRRRSKATVMIERHIHGFSGVKPVVLDALIRNWKPRKAHRQHKWMGEHDMARLQSMLQENGFFPRDDAVWTSLSEAEVREELEHKYEIAETYPPR